MYLSCELAQRHVKTQKVKVLTAIAQKGELFLEIVMNQEI